MVTAQPYLPGGGLGAPLIMQLEPLPGGMNLTMPADAPAEEYLVVAHGSGCAIAAGSIQLMAAPILFSQDFESNGNGVQVLLWRTEHVVLDPQGPPTDWRDGEGHPGRALSAAWTDAADPWYFTVFPYLEDADLGWLRFDIRGVASGGPVAAPAIILDSQVHVGGGMERTWVEHDFPVPPGPTWTHQDLSLADPVGWTYHDVLGSRPATIEDLHLMARHYGTTFWIRGPTADGPNETWIDNVSIELQ